MKEDSKFLETDKLMELIKNSPEKFNEMLVNGDFSDDLSLDEYLCDLLSKHNISLADVVRISLISKSYVYQIFNGERMPSRDILIRIGISMSCDVDEMQHLLLIAQTGVLYPKVKRDAAILSCISQKMSLEETNDFLEHIEERTLL
ncbi:MAG: helix-turn-helix transcriptional regulator [Lachnospiraceae bacterium]|nr:helix-turn-helix transcriptional regulator [Lachnospiraceae bacterium]MBQ9233135.1 helix-turn-helix transcriptional regulator [Lachnospiraceae bacterium]